MTTQISDCRAVRLAVAVLAITSDVLCEWTGIVELEKLLRTDT